MIRFLVLILFVLFSMTAFSKPKGALKKSQVRVEYSKLSRIQKLPLLSTKQYSKFSTKNKKNYIKNMRAAWVSFEKGYVASQKIPVVWFQSLLWESAFAAEGKCIIGGVILDTVSGKCPTRANTCKGKEGTFQCGEIFESVCVKREPIDDLSQRCSDEGQTKILSDEEYEVVKNKILTDYKSICESGSMPSNTQDGCNFLAQRLAAGAQELGVAKAELPNADYIDYGDIQRLSIPLSDPECPNDLDKDRETGQYRQLVVPKFSFEENRRCLFDRNQKYLGEVARSGCVKLSDAADDMIFTSRIEFLDNETDSLFSDIVIEKMDKVSESPSAGLSVATYMLQYLEPKVVNGKVTFERKSREVQRKVYNTNNCSDAKVTCSTNAFCNADRKCEENILIIPDSRVTYEGLENLQRPIRIYNTQRKNIMPEVPIMKSSFESTSVTQSYFNDVMDKRVGLAQNCEFSKGLTTAGYYNPLNQPSTKGSH